MAKPNLEGCGGCLKKNKSGKSKFWIVGMNIFIGDIVKIKVDSETCWQGNITKSDVHKHMAKVKYVGPTKKTKPKDDADLEDVDITVTNADGTSDPITDCVPIDPPATP